MTQPRPSPLPGIRRQRWAETLDRDALAALADTLAHLLAETYRDKRRQAARSQHPIAA